MARHDIIVIGASAGGTEALRQVFHDLPADFPAAIFLMTHLPSGTPSVLPRLLGAASRLPIVEATDGAAIENGRIRVAPSGAHLLSRAAASRQAVSRRRRYPPGGGDRR